MVCKPRLGRAVFGQCFGSVRCVVFGESTELWSISELGSCPLPPSPFPSCNRLGTLFGLIHHAPFIPEFPVKMHVSSVLGLAAIVSLVGAAAPRDQVPLEPKSCTIKLPTSYQQIVQSQPKQSFPQGNLFNVSQDSSGAVDTLLRFTNIPSGSFGCQVAVSFTFGFPIDSEGSTLLNVYALPNPISSSDTYATYFPDGGRGTPKGSFLWATTTITGQKAVLNSETCKPTLGYLFQIASSTKAGSVSFRDAGNNLSGIGGFYLTYNC